MAEHAVSPVLQVVRYLDDADGDDEDLEPVMTADGRVLEKLAGQHQLLGWHLTSADLALLAIMSAALDVDEYG